MEVSSPSRVKTECSDHLVACGENRLRLLVNEFVSYYNHERPHQGVGNVPLPEADGPPILRFPSGEVRCAERLGGLLRHYHRAA